MKNKETTFKRTGQIVDGISVEVVTTQKFKTVTIGLFYERPLKNFQNALNALTLSVMIKACSKMDPMMLNQRLHELYGAYLQADAFKYGDRQSLQLKLTVVGDEHVSESIFDQAMDLIYDLIQAPVSHFSGFEQLVALEKKHLISDIAARKNDKTAYAFDLLLEGCYKDHPYSLSPHGLVSDIESITPEDIRLQIESLFQKVPHKLIVLGDVKPEAVFRAVQRQKLHVANVDSQIRTKGNPQSTDQSVIKQATDQSVVEQATGQSVIKQDTDQSGPLNWRYEDKVGQSKLNIAYCIPEPLDVKEYYAMIVFTHLLGGGGGSVLFEDIREKQSLCYYIHARMDKFIKILTVMSGVRLEQIDRVVASVEEHILRLQTELVDPLQLERTKKMLLGSYRGLADSPPSYINFIHSQELVELPVDLDVITKMVSDVDCEGVRLAAKKIVPMAIFALIPESVGQ